MTTRLRIDITITPESNILSRAAEALKELVALIESGECDADGELVVECDLGERVATCAYEWSSDSNWEDQSEIEQDS